MSNDIDGEERAATSSNYVRQCWVCFASDIDDPLAEWVQPCNCRGTAKWVHQTCLQRWVDEKQKGGGAYQKVVCPQCQTEYLIVFPNMGTLVNILDSIDSFTYRLCPFLAAGILVSSIYWSAATYGAITVMQTVGQKEALMILEQVDPFILIVGLPSIPVALICGKMVHWEDMVLEFIRKYLVHVPLVKYVLPFQIEIRPNQSIDNVRTVVPPLSDPVSATRILCGALLLPSIAVICGRIFFDSVQSNFHRTILGGLTFIAVKGCLKIYHKQQQYVRQCKRHILDYTESNVAMFQQQTRQRLNISNNNSQNIDNLR